MTAAALHARVRCLACNGTFPAYECEPYSVHPVSDGSLWATCRDCASDEREQRREATRASFSAGKREALIADLVAGVLSPATTRAQLRTLAERLAQTPCVVCSAPSDAGMCRPCRIAEVSR